MSEFVSQSNRENWDRLAEHDAMWAILTDPARRGGGWTAEAFFATGVAEADRVMGAVRSAVPHFSPAGGIALDFGCGIGRLARAFGARFAHVVGVDISAAMLARAEACNPEKGRITYVLGNPSGIPLADASVDFAYSGIVLQHVPRSMQEGYVREFFRVLRPGGLAWFQTPGRHLRDLGNIFFGQVETTTGPARIELHMFPRAAVEATVAAAGAKLVRVFADASCGADFESWAYLARRRPGP